MKSPFEVVGAGKIIWAIVLTVAAIPIPVLWIGALAMWGMIIGASVNASRRPARMEDMLGASSAVRFHARTKTMMGQMRVEERIGNYVSDCGRCWYIRHTGKGARCEYGRWSLVRPSGATNPCGGQQFIVLDAPLLSLVDRVVTASPQNLFSTERRSRAFDAVLAAYLNREPGGEAVAASVSASVGPQDPYLNEGGIRVWGSSIEIGRTIQNVASATSAKKEFRRARTRYATTFSLAVIVLSAGLIGLYRIDYMIRNEFESIPAKTVQTALALLAIVVGIALVVWGVVQTRRPQRDQWVVIIAGSRGKMVIKGFSDEALVDRVIHAINRSMAETPACRIEIARSKLVDPNARVREAATQELGEFGAAAAGGLPDLENLLTDPDWGVRSRAEWAIGEIRRDKWG